MGKKNKTKENKHQEKKKKRKVLRLDVNIKLWSCHPLPILKRHRTKQMCWTAKRFFALWHTLAETKSLSKCIKF